MTNRRFDLEKQPGEKFTIGVEFANDLVASETISSATITAVDTSDDSDVSLTILSGSASIVDGDATLSKITQKVQEGTDGDEYKITFKAHTSNSNIFEADVIVTIEEL